MTLEPNSLTRRVHFALELVDPFTGANVYRGIEIEAKAADGRPTGDEPVINRSGRFVWIARDQSRRPAIASIAYRPVRLPFVPGEIDLAGGPPAGKLVSRRLTPTHAYSVPLGVTAIRGRLVGEERRRDHAHPSSGRADCLGDGTATQLDPAVPDFRDGYCRRRGADRWRRPIPGVCPVAQAPYQGFGLHRPATRRWAGVR